MTSDVDGFLDEAPPKGLAMERIKGLSTGGKVLLVGCALLFFSLFLTWQNLEIDFGQAGTATQMLDGWDVWGLLIAFVLIGLVSLVLIVKVSDLELPTTVPWELVIVVVSVALLGLVLLKNLTDANSAWASYLGVALAGLVVAGAALDWRQARNEWRSGLRRRRRVR
jgi:hypothetical protein